MQSKSDFLTDEIVDHAMSGYSVPALECVGHDADSKVRFTAAIELFLMPGMQVAFIDDLNKAGIECLFYFLFDRL